jgi:hypothetical protein
VNRNSLPYFWSLHVPPLFCLPKPRRGVLVRFEVPCPSGLGTDDLEADRYPAPGGVDEPRPPRRIEVR